MGTIRFENVSKEFPGMGRPAVDNCSLEVTEGNFVVILGPSGCGKSTFLRSLNRMNDTIASARAEGKVLLKVHIAANGGVVNATVVRAEPKGYGFEQAAVAAVRQWRFAPPSQGVPIWVYQPIRFSLND